MFSVGNNVYANNKFDEEFFNLNNILYYDAGDGECISGGSAISLSGNTNAEKVWNFFKSLNYTDEAVAGIVGNWQTESGVEPRRYEADHVESLKNKYDQVSKDPTLEGGLGSNWAFFTSINPKLNEQGYLHGSDGKHYIGLGLGQWTGPRNYALWDYSGKGKNLWDLGTQLKFMTEKDGKAEWLTGYKSFNGSAGDAAQNFMMGWEGVDYKRQERIEAANEAYETFKGTKASGSGNSSSSSGITADDIDNFIKSRKPSSPLIGYGKSFIKHGNAYGIDPALMVAIAGFESSFATAGIAAIPGKNNPFGITSQSEADGHASFPSIDAGIEAEAKLLSSDIYKDVINDINKLASIYSPVGASNDPNGTNGLWPNGVNSIYKELTGEDYKGGFTGSSSSGGSCDGLNGGNNGDIAARAIELAHPEEKGENFDITPKQKEALEKTGLVNYGEQWVVQGASCDAFVSMVMSTTVDPDFVKHCCGVANLRDYMAKTPDKYENIPYSKDALQPGDIMTAGRGGGPNAHIQIYVEINGQGKVANAGWSRTVGVIEPLNLSVMENLGEVEIWRWKG